jgi:hypothetical protein
MNTTLDGCSDFNGTRVVNLLCWFAAVRRLSVRHKKMFLWAFGQFWADDSPSNKIEHLWTYLSKRLAHTVISACAEGDDVQPREVGGLSADEVREKEYTVLEYGMEVINDKLSGVIVEGFGAQISNVIPGDSADLKAQTEYTMFMEFAHASAKKIEGSTSTVYN